MTSSSDSDKSNSGAKNVSKAAVDPNVHKAAAQGSRAAMGSSKAAAPYISESLLDHIEKEAKAQKASKSSTTTP
jgi:hypothetical protein